MTALPLSAPAFPKTSIRHPAIAAALALLIAAFVIRAPSFGNPALFIDEQFYLLVGDRMLHGALPYVDIWDRKPIGLFLIYAAIRLLGGEGIIQYQAVAALFAAAGSFAVSRIARRVAPEPAALAAGLSYLLWIEQVEGGGGQSPVFYNPLVAAAALATLCAHAAADDRRYFRFGFAAMLLGGLAIQIKYTAAIEVAFFGLTFAISLVRRKPAGQAIALTIVLAAVALGPTLLATLAFAAAGHLDAFLFANFTSIGLRDAGIDGKAAERLRIGLSHLLPLAACCAASAFALRRGNKAEKMWGAFMIGWMVAALVGFACVGAFYYHYLLPLYVPLAVGIAPIVGRMPIGIGFGAIALLVPLANLGWPAFADTRHTREQVDHLVSLLPPDAKQRCLYEFDGPPILYLRGQACAHSRFVFPDHLASRVEARALGVDPVAEMGRIMARRPAAITIGHIGDETRNPATFAVVRRALVLHYRLAGTGEIDRRRIDLYVRR